MKDVRPVEYAEEGAKPVEGKWPGVTKPTSKRERAVYPGAGSELYDFLRQ
jgi:hypothetical protein